MRLNQYLDLRGESGVQFATRAGVPQRTVADIIAGGGCRISTAQKIVEASRSAPAPGGGTVTYEELVPAGEGGSSANGSAA